MFFNIYFLHEVDWYFCLKKSVNQRKDIKFWTIHRILFIYLKSFWILFTSSVSFLQSNKKVNQLENKNKNHLNYLYSLIIKLNDFTLKYFSL